MREYHRAQESEAAGEPDCGLEREGLQEADREEEDASVCGEAPVLAGEE